MNNKELEFLKAEIVESTNRGYSYSNLREDYEVLAKNAEALRNGHTTLRMTIKDLETAIVMLNEDLKGARQEIERLQAIGAACAGVGQCV